MTFEVSFCLVVLVSRGLQTIADPLAVSLPFDYNRHKFADLSSHSSSKLANLFGHDKASFTGGNESLKYTAPKQPKKDKPGKLACV